MATQMKKYAKPLRKPCRASRKGGVLNFASVQVEIFAKEDGCTSDLECAKQLGFRKLEKLNQVHGNVIHIVREPSDGNLKGDGLITDVPHLALSIRFADCQAFVMYEPKKKVIGVLHVGWRGLAKTVITAFYEKLNEYFSIRPEETFVGAGPSLCKACAVFSQPYEELPEHLHAFIDGQNVDLQGAAEAEFDALGIPKNQKDRHPACTKCDLSWLSWRRDRDPNARNYLVAGLML